MNGNFDTKIREKIERGKERIKKKRGVLESEEIDKKRVYNSLSNQEQAIGVYSLVLGEEREAKRLFKDSAIHNLNSVKLYRDYAKEQGKVTWENEPLKIRDALYVGLLSQDQRSIDEVCQSSLKTPEVYPEKYRETRPWYDFSLGLASFIKADTRDYQGYLGDLEEHAEEFDELMALRYRGLAEAIMGVATGDSAKVSDGISDIIPYHVANRHPNSTKSSDLICLPAATIYVLALMNGVSPTIDRTYIPDTLNEEYIETHY